MDITKVLLRKVFNEAAEIEEPAVRAAFLDSACKGDIRLRQRVEQLLAADSQAGGFLRDEPEPEAKYADTPSVKPGERIGRYRILDQLGRGGYGVVYLAEQEEPVRRRVALKLIKLGMDTQAVIARFEAERQALALMDHPNIARVYDAGSTESGRPFFVMELVSGIPITEYCDNLQLSIPRRLELFIQVCQAIQHAHQKGIIHRDVKPSNILVAEQDGVPVPKVIDFGVAKATEQQLGAQSGLTSADQFIGTPAYMSPEQVEFGGRDIDTRSDIYSLGVVLYELVTGRPPFRSKELALVGLQEMRRMICEVEPPKPSTCLFNNDDLRTLTLNRSAFLRERVAAVRGDVDWIAMKCLEKDRTRRYETANGLAMDIRRHLDDEAIVARPASGVYRLRKIFRRNRLAFAAAGAIVLVLVAASIVSALLALRATRAEQEQRKLRTDAQAGQARETNLREEAELRTEESQQRVLKRYVAEGNRLIEQGNAFAALPWLTEALRMELANPVRESQERLRIGQALENLPQLQHNFVQGKWIQCIAFSPDSALLATGSDDHMILIRDSLTGQTTLPALEMKDAVGALQFDPNGSHLVATDLSGWTRVWNLTDGTPVTPWLRPQDYDGNSVAGVLRWLAPSLQFSPDGKQLLTAWGSRSAQILDAGTGKLQQALTHKEVVYHASFSADGKYVVSSSRDGAVLVWDAKTGKRVGPSLQHDDPVYWAGFAPDGTNLVTICDRVRMQCWNWMEGKRVGPEIRSEQPIYRVVFSPDGRNLLTANWDRTARLYKLPSCEEIRLFQHPSGVVDAAFSPDGALLATACYDGNAWVWETRIDRKQPLALLPQGDETDRVRFTPDGRRLGVAGRGGLGRIWELFPSRKSEQQLPGQRIQWAEFNALTTQLVLGGGRDCENVSVFDAATGKRISGATIPGMRITVARFSGDGRRILAFGSGRNAHVCEAATGRESFPPLEHTNTITDARWSADSRWIATAFEGGARVWDATSGKLFRELVHTNQLVAQVGFSPNGKLLATGVRWRHEVWLWDMETGKLALPPLQAPARIRELRFRPDGKRLAISSHTRGTDGIVHLRDVETGAVVGKPMVHRDEILTFDFTADGRWVLTSGEDHQARVWDGETGEPVSPWLPHADEVRHTQVSPDGNTLATVTSSGDVRLWNPLTGEPITQSIQYPHANDRGRLGFTWDGRRLLIATGANGAWIRDLIPASESLEQLERLARVLACRRIDPDAGIIPLDSRSLSNAWQELRAEQ